MYRAPNFYESCAHIQLPGMFPPRQLQDWHFSHLVYLIGRVSGSMEALAAAVNPHKEAVELVEQQMDTLILSDNLP